MTGRDPVRWVNVILTDREEDVSDRVTQFSFDEESNKAAKLTFSVDNYDLSNFDEPVIKNGNLVEFSFGYVGSMAPTRRGTIQKVTGSTTLSVEVLGLSILLAKYQKVRTFEQATIADVARRIAAENGYGEGETFVDDLGVDGDPLPVLATIQQARMSDAVFLAQWARKIGFVFQADRGFVFQRRKLGQLPLRKITYFRDPGVGDVLSFNVENDVHAKKTSGASAKGRDPLRKETFEVRADNTENAGRTTLAPEVELFTGISERDGAALPDTAKRAVASTTSTGTSAPDAASAKQEAGAVYAASQLSALEMTMEVRGDPRLAANLVVEVDGIGKKHSGNYFVQKATHKLGTTYTTSLKLRRDGTSGGKGVIGPAVKAKAAVNSAQAPAAAATELYGPRVDLLPVSQRDGSVAYVDAGGQSRADAPFDPVEFYGGTR